MVTNLIQVSGVANEWSPDFVRLLQRTIRTQHRVHMKIDYTGEQSVKAQISGVLFNFEELGDLFFDILNSFEQPKLDLEKTLEEIKNLVFKIPMYEYVYTMRNVLKSLKNYEAHLALVRINAFIIFAYNQGRIAGVNSAKKIVYTENKIDGTLYELAVELEMVKRKLTKEDKHFIPIAPSDKKLILKRLKEADSLNLLSELASLKTKDIIARRLTRGYDLSMLQVSSLFNELDENYCPSVDMSNSYISRSKPTCIVPGVNHEAVVIINSAKHCALIMEKLLTRRSLILRDKGMRIEFKDPHLIGLNWIEFKEVHLDDKFKEHYVLINYSATDSTSGNIILPIDGKNFQLVKIYTDGDAVAFMVACKLYGLAEVLKLNEESLETLAMIDFKHNTNPAPVEAYKRANRLLDDLLDEATSKENIVFLEPTSSNNYKPREVTKLGIQVCETHPGQKPSQQALDLASKYRMDLLEGFTLEDVFETV